MTTIATIAVPVADNWQITAGSGWIVVMLIGMAACFVAMFAFMSLMRVRKPDAAPGSSESEAGR